MDIRNTTIEYIVDQIVARFNTAMIGFIAEGMIENIRKFVRSQLVDLDIETLSLSELAEFVEILYKDLQYALIEPGRAVGVIAAQVIGEKSTQGSLNAFHAAGINIGRVNFSGLPRLQEVINVSEKMKHPMMFLYMNEPHTFDQIRKLIPKYQYTILIDVVSNRQILTSEQVPEEGWHRLNEQVFGDRGIKRPPWILRLYLDKTQLYKRKITPKKIADTIHSQMEHVRAVFSGINLERPIIDIYHDQEFDTSKLEEGIQENELLRYHLRDFVWLQLTRIVLGGIPSVNGLTPVAVSLTEAIKGYKQDEGGYRIEYNDDFMLRNSIRKPEVNEFILKQVRDVQPEATLNNGILSTTLDTRRLQMAISSLAIPFYFLMVDVREEENGYRVLLNMKAITDYDVSMEDIYLAAPNYTLEGNVFLIRDVGPQQFEDIRQKMIYSGAKRMRGNHWYLETDGSNLRGAFAMPEVNTRVSTTNVLSEVYDVLDVEACRQFLVEEFVLNGATNVNPSHTRLLADVMIHEGFPLPITRHGLAKQNNEFLQRMNFEENQKNAFIAASGGETDKLGSSAASLIVGNLINIGTNVQTFSIEYRPPQQTRTNVVARKGRKPASRRK